MNDVFLDIQKALFKATLSLAKRAGQCPESLAELEHWWLEANYFNLRGKLLPIPRKIIWETWLLSRIVCRNSGDIYFLFLFVGFFFFFLWLFAEILISVNLKESLISTHPPNDWGTVLCESQRFKADDWYIHQFPLVIMDSEITRSLSIMFFHLSQISFLLMKSRSSVPTPLTALFISSLKYSAGKWEIYQ